MERKARERAKRKKRGLPKDVEKKKGMFPFSKRGRKTENDEA